MSDILAILAARRNARPQLLYKLEDFDIETLHGELFSVAAIATPSEVLTAAELLVPAINAGSCQEVWVTNDGRRIKIGDMAYPHIVHALAKIMRDARSGYAWAVDTRVDGLRRFHLKEKHNFFHSPHWL